MRSIFGYNMFKFALLNWNSIFFFFLRWSLCGNSWINVIKHFDLDIPFDGVPIISSFISIFGYNSLKIFIGIVY